mmetsp:Transcript_148882/g.263144  ORF Transcript_148882/g.263144 Transcript_148882/m.263144 type:complete len:263 (+) Transcript_148882:252-1040(+)
MPPSDFLDFAIASSTAPAFDMSSREALGGDTNGGALGLIGTCTSFGLSAMTLADLLIPVAGELRGCTPVSLVLALCTGPLFERFGIVGFASAEGGEVGGAFAARGGATTLAAGRLLPASAPSNAFTTGRSDAEQPLVASEGEGEFITIVSGTRRLWHMGLVAAGAVFAHGYLTGEVAVAPFVGTTLRPKSFSMNWDMGSASPFLPIEGHVKQPIVGCVGVSQWSSATVPDPNFIAGWCNGAPGFCGSMKYGDSLLSYAQSGT